nr:acyl-coenzyme A thioesterase 9, mitochondrial-like [Lepeophtheirus salmonis]
MVKKCVYVGCGTGADRKLPSVWEDAFLSSTDIINIFTEKSVGKNSYFNPSGTFIRDSISDEMIPKSQEELPLRRMIDSFERAVIPLSKDLKLRDRYTTSLGQVRYGRLLEDMDVFSVYLCYKHLHHPNQGAISPFTVVTALVDRLKIISNLSIEEDIRMSGQVTWSGSSSLEASIEIHQGKGSNWHKCVDATFLLASRNPSNTGKSYVNKLQLDTPEEKALFQQGANNKRARLNDKKEGLFDKAPKQEEGQLVHDMFVKTLDNSSLSFKSRVIPPNSIWMEDAKLKTVKLCQPENRNRFNKIFGGFIMREAAELAWMNAYTYSGQVPSFYHIDDIIFRKPVEIGSIMYMNSQVCFTHENFVQIRVSAEIFNPETKKNSISNVFEFTFKNNYDVPMVMPKTYQEAIMFINARRHFLSIF